MKLLRLMMYGGAGAAGVAAYNCDSTACRIAKEALRERAAEALELAPSSAGEAASNLEAWMKAMQDHLEQIVTRQDNAHAQSLALMQAQTAALTGMANSRSSRVSVIGATGAALVGVYFFARWRGWSLMGLLPATRKALSRMAKQLDEARCALEAAVATLKQDITERQEQAQRGIEDIQERTESMQGQMRALEDGQGDVSEKLDRLRRAQVLGLQMTYTMGQALYEALCRVGTSPSPAVRELGGLTKQVVTTTGADDTGSLQRWLSARTTGARGQKAPSSSAPFDDLDDLFSRGRALDASVFDSKW
ncbi:unnamed protein product [Pedinophyceae sp. YPF-701]|nr:unnamed protein product [Pedinophyceae sp. YPF-701]